jgi:hypothetical protein
MEIKKSFLIAFISLFSLPAFSQAPIKDTSSKGEKEPVFTFSEVMQAVNFSVQEVPTKSGDEVRQKFYQYLQQVAKQKQIPPSGKPK